MMKLTILALALQSAAGLVSNSASSLADYPGCECSVAGTGVKSSCLALNASYQPGAPMTSIQNTLEYDPLTHRWYWGLAREKNLAFCYETNMKTGCDCRTCKTPSRWCSCGISWWRSDWRDVWKRETGSEAFPCSLAVISQSEGCRSTRRRTGGECTAANVGEDVTIPSRPTHPVGTPFCRSLTYDHEAALIHDGIINKFGNFFGTTDNLNWVVPPTIYSNFSQLEVDAGTLKACLDGGDPLRGYYRSALYTPSNRDYVGSPPHDGFVEMNATGLMNVSLGDLLACSYAPRSQVFSKHDVTDLAPPSPLNARLGAWQCPKSQQQACKCAGLMHDEGCRSLHPERRIDLASFLANHLPKPWMQCQDASGSGRRASAVVNGVELPEVEWRVEFNDNCTPVCPTGQHSSVDSITCNFGITWPVFYTCHDTPPESRVLDWIHDVSFADKDRRKDWLAGPLQVEFLRHHWPREILGITHLNAYWGTGSVTKVSQSLVARAAVEIIPFPYGSFDFTRGLMPADVGFGQFRAWSMNMFPFYDTDFRVSSGKNKLMTQIDKTFHPELVSQFATPVDMWIRPTPIPAGATHLLIFPANWYGETTDPYVLRFADISGDTARSLTMSDERGSSFSPFVGSPFILQIGGEGLSPTEEISFTASDKSCSFENTEQSIVLSQSSVALNTQGGPVRQWRGVAKQSGSFRACLWSSTSSLCRQKGSVSSVCESSFVDLGNFSVRRCRPPCKTCHGMVDRCTSCLEQGFQAIAGSCAKCKESTAAGDNTSDCRGVAVVERIIDKHRVHTIGNFGMESFWNNMDVDDVFNTSLPCGQTLKSVRQFDAVGSTMLLIADPESHAVLRFSLVTGVICLACPQCGSSNLRHPETVRVAPSGTFFLVGDTWNFYIRRVDLFTFEMKSVAGSAPLVNPIGSSSGDGGLALKAHLCYVVDLAIHSSERSFLFAERSCQDHFEDKVRFVDETQHINTVLSLGRCTSSISMDWMLGDQFFIVACGRMHALERASGQWRSVSLQGDIGKLTGIHMARSTFNQEVLVSRKVGHTTLLEAWSLISGSPLRTVAGGGGFWKWRQWADQVKLQLGTFIVATDGTVFIADASNAIQRLHVCGPGRGPVNSTFLQCGPCPVGSYNNGSRVLMDQCARCSGNQEITTAASQALLDECESCERVDEVAALTGSVHCNCMPGFHRSNKEDTCETCSPGSFCPGSAVDESEHQCPGGFESTTFSIAQDTSFNMGALRVSATHSASSSELCACRFGHHFDVFLSRCEPCPPGLWCSNALASSELPLNVSTLLVSFTSQSGFVPAPEMPRLKNGYWAPRTGTEPWEVQRCMHPSHCWWSTLPQQWRAHSRAPCRKVAGGAKYSTHCMGVQVGATFGSCPRGRAGFACSQCSSGTHAVVTGKQCQPCENSVAVVVTTISAMVLMGGLLHIALLKLKGARLDALYCVVSGIIVLISFGEQIKSTRVLTHIRWPIWQEQAMIAYESCVSAVWRIHSECLAGDSVVQQLMLLLIPLSLPLSLVLFWLLFKATTPLRRRLPNRLSYLRDFRLNPEPLVNTSGLVVLVVIVPLTGSVCSFLQCFPDPASSSSRRSFYYASQELCFSPSWYYALPFGMLGLCYLIGWFAVQIMLWRSLPALALMPHGTTGQGSRESFASTASAQQWDLLKPLLDKHRHIYARLRCGMHFWDMAVFLRVFVLHMAFVFGPIFTLAAKSQLTTVIELLSVFLANALFLFGLVAFRPHKSGAMNFLEGSTTIVTMMVMSTGLAIDGDMLVRLDEKPYLWSFIICCIFAFSVKVAMKVATGIFRPSVEAQRNLLVASELAFTLHQIGVASSNVSAEMLIEIANHLDSHTNRKARQSLWSMEQLTMPNSVRIAKQDAGELKLTRLLIADQLPKEVEEELERNFAEHSSCNADGSVRNSMQSASEDWARKEVGTQSGSASRASRSGRLSELPTSAAQLFANVVPVRSPALSQTRQSPTAEQQPDSLPSPISPASLACYPHRH